jgi:hypothetical protein
LFSPNIHGTVINWGQSQSPAAVAIRMDVKPKGTGMRIISTFYCNVQKDYECGNERHLLGENKNRGSVKYGVLFLPAAPTHLLC